MKTHLFKFMKTFPRVMGWTFFSVALIAAFAAAGYGYAALTLYLEGLVPEPFASAIMVFFVVIVPIAFTYSALEVIFSSDK